MNVPESIGPKSWVQSASDSSMGKLKTQTNKQTLTYQRLTGMYLGSKVEHAAIRKI